MTDDGSSEDIIQNNTIIEDTQSLLEFDHHTSTSIEDKTDKTTTASSSTTTAKMSFATEATESTTAPASSSSINPPPTDAMMELLAPDGYYKYLGIPKPPPSGGDVDQDLIKKNYRRLSLKHHPDKRGGDADTFRLLNRAQKVLSTTKLRQQYDNLGLDLDDDDDQAMTTTNNTSSEGEKGTGEDDDEQTTSQGIVHEIASMALTTVLQMGVRTLMMMLVSVIVVRYRWLLFPALAFLAFVAFRIYSISTSPMETASPFLIAIGLIIMHQSSKSTGWFLYWIGESLVIGMFTYNSMGTVQQKTIPLFVGIFIFSTIAALWFRGKFWNYVIVLGLEVFLAIFIAMAFPIMEMVLEAILNDKLRKVGDKVRAHHQYMERYYNSKR